MSVSDAETMKDRRFSELLAATNIMPDIDTLQCLVDISNDKHNPDSDAASLVLVMLSGLLATELLAVHKQLETVERERDLALVEVECLNGQAKQLEERRAEYEDMLHDTSITGMKAIKELSDALKKAEEERDAAQKELKEFREQIVTMISDSGNYAVAGQPMGAIQTIIDELRAVKNMVHPDHQAVSSRVWEVVMELAYWRKNSTASQPTAQDLFAVCKGEYTPTDNNAVKVAELKAEIESLREQLAPSTPDGKLSQWKAAKAMVENPPKIALKWAVSATSGRLLRVYDRLDLRGNMVARAAVHERWWMVAPREAVDLPTHLTSEEAGMILADEDLKLAGWELVG